MSLRLLSFVLRVYLKFSCLPGSLLEGIGLSISESLLVAYVHSLSILEFPVLLYSAWCYKQMEMTEENIFCPLKKKNCLRMMFDA